MTWDDGGTVEAALQALVDAAALDMPPAITALAETLQQRLDEREAAQEVRQSLPVA